MIPLLTEAPLLEEGVMLVPLVVTLNWSALGLPLSIPVKTVPPLKTSIVVPESAVLATAPSLPAGKVCDSLDKTTV